MEKVDQRNDPCPIGTMKEKSVHHFLKGHYVANEAYHEIKIGNFYADACIEGEIYEIQTRNFYLLKKKLDTFLKEYDVTIVYPVSMINTICWINPDTGEITKGNTSKLKRRFYQFFREIYSIRDYLSKDNLHFIITCLETTDYRILDGYGLDHKKRASKTDKVPEKIVSETYLNSANDIRQLIPADLGNTFSARDFSKATSLNSSDTSKAMLVLMALNIVNRIGKRDKSFVYELVPDCTLNNN